MAAGSAVNAVNFGLSVGGVVGGLNFFAFTVDVQGVWFLLLFYFIDATALAARRSDPLLRDSLSWKKIRGPLWVANIGAFVFGLVYHLPIQYLLTLVAGVALLPVIARRSGDFTFRKHLRWFGLYVLFLALSFGALGLIGAFSVVGQVSSSGYSNPLYDSGTALFAVLAWSGAYSLYRSAKSLVPLNRISLLDLTSPLAKETSFKPSTSFGQLVKAGNVLHRRGHLG